MSTPPVYDEKNALLQLADGNEEAFQQVYNTYWGKIYSIALAWTKSVTQAEDIVQEVFIKVWNQRAKLPHLDRFDSFLFIIARNIIIDQFRKKIRHLPVDHEQDYLPGDFMLPDATLDLKQSQTIILQAIDQLPAQQKAVFKMSREEGLTHEQIAERLGIARVTVKNHIVRALNTLRDQLAQQHGTHFSLAWLLLFHYLSANR